MTDHIGIGGAWRTKAGEWIGVGGAWRPISSALAASATDATGGGSGYAGEGDVTSSPTSLTVTGGSGNYTYAWSKVSGEDFTISSATTRNPYWYAYLADGFHSATWKVVVTDTSYGVTAEATISVVLHWTNLN